MTDLEAPDGLTNALRGVGRHLVGPADPDGHRWWVRADDGTRGLVTVVPGSAPGGSAEVRRRVAAVTSVQHEHIVGLGPALRLPGDATAVLQQQVEGYDLDTARAARGPWSPGEVVTVLVPLAGAVAALHDAGVSHEATTRNVVLTPDGRAVLVGLVGLVGYRGVLGHDGVADLRVAGPEDVGALGRLGLELLGPSGRRAPGRRRSPRFGPAERLHVERPGHAESSEPEDPQVAAQRARVWQVLSLAVGPEVAERPTAIRLASELYRACPPVPVEQPDRAVLAGLALRRPQDATKGRDRGRHRRSTRPARRWLQVGAASIAVAVCGVTVAATVTGATTDRGSTAAHEVTEVDASDVGLDVSPSVVDLVDLVDPVDAAVALTHARAEALVHGDLAALRRVTVPGSRAARGDEVAARDAAASGVVGGTLTTRIEIAEELPAGDGPGGTDDAGPCPGCVRVHLRSAVTALAGEGDGAQAPAPGSPPVPGAESGGAAPATRARDVVLVLAPTDDGWRVSDVREHVP